MQHRISQRSHRSRSGARKHLNQAIIHRLKWEMTLALEQERLAWTMPDCTPIVFAEYHLKLASRLAREGRFSEANEIFERAKKSGVLRGYSGRNAIASACRIINLWRRVNRLDLIPA